MCSQAVDSLFLQYLVHKTLEKSASVHLLFAFEYVILASAIVSTFLKYTLSMIDAWLEGRWEHKGVYVFYLELLTDMLHLVVYLVFFVIVFTNFGLPVHLVRLPAIFASLPASSSGMPFLFISWSVQYFSGTGIEAWLWVDRRPVSPSVQLRDLYWTFRNFRNRVVDFLRYRRVTANMDERFSNATEEVRMRLAGLRTGLAVWRCIGPQTLQYTKQTEQLQTDCRTWRAAMASASSAARK